VSRCWRRILDYILLFDTGDQDWESICNRFLELSSPEACRTFNDQDVAEVKEEVSAIIISREPEEDDYGDVIAHAVGYWRLIDSRLRRAMRYILPGVTAEAE
jgi:hypothetical protein